jgi:hypothetical protein
MKSALTQSAPDFLSPLFSRFTGPELLVALAMLCVTVVGVVAIVVSRKGKK